MWQLFTRFRGSNIYSRNNTITDDVKEWLNRPLKPLYSFVFVDCIYVKMKNERGIVDNHAVYVLLGVDYEGFKEVLGLYISSTESKSTWMKIFDTIKARGVEDILFLSMDGVSGLSIPFSLRLLFSVVLFTLSEMPRSTLQNI